MNFPPLGPPAFANFPKENGLQTITCRTVRAEGPQALGPLPVTQQVVLKLPKPDRLSGWGHVLGMAPTHGQLVLRFWRFSCVCWLFKNINQPKVSLYQRSTFWGPGHIWVGVAEWMS